MASRTGSSAIAGRGTCGGPDDQSVSSLIVLPATWATAFSGSARWWIHAVSGIWSHRGGHVCGSARAGITTTKATARPPATSIVARITRIGITPVRAQS